jgi:hypothetical protein
MSPRSRVRHELKTWPEFFAATRQGHKKFELRRDDRPEGFQVGDELLLREWDPTQKKGILIPGDDEYGIYTGQEVLVRVDYVMSADIVRKLIHPLLEPDEMDEFVIMSISLVN